MADEPVEEQAEESEEGAPKASRLKQFVLLAVLVLAAQSAITYVLVTKFLLSQMGEEQTETTETATVKDWPEVDIDALVLHDVGELVLNPKDEETMRYLSTHVVLQLESEDVKAELEDKIVAAKIRELVR